MPWLRRGGFRTARIVAIAARHRPTRFVGRRIVDRRIHDHLPRHAAEGLGVDAGDSAIVTLTALVTFVAARGRRRRSHGTTSRARTIACPPRHRKPLMKHLRLPVLVALALAAAAPAQTGCGVPHLLAVPTPGASAGTRLYDVHAFAPDSAWAVGSRWQEIGGQTNSFAWILHWNGTTFTEIPCPSPGVPGLRTWCELLAVGGSGPNDVWAAGQYERQHPNNGHIGPQMFFLHWNGSAWTHVPEPLPQFSYMASSSGAHVNKILAFAANDVWFLGRWSGDQFTSGGPLALRWNGSSFQFANVATPPNTNNYWRWVDADGPSPSQMWAVGAVNGAGYGTMVGEWNGSSFTPRAIPTLPITYYELMAVGVVSSTDVWVAGSEKTLNPSTPIAPYTIHWNGSTWTRVPTTGYVREFLAIASDDVWAFGTTIEHWNGTAWTVVATYADTQLSAQSWGVTAAGPCELLTVGTQWSSSNGPPVAALAARIGASGAGAATLRMPCTTPALPQSLLPTGTPRVGQPFPVAVDDPFGLLGLAAGTPTAWVWAYGPGPLAPCGTVLPGLGLGGSAIEVLLDVSATVVGVSPWPGPGLAAWHVVQIPPNPTLTGLTFATQAAFVTTSGLVATSALDLVIGS